MSDWETVSSPNDGWETVPQTPKVTASDRVGAVGAGANRGIASLLGLPVDTFANVVDLANAGLGYGASLFNKGKVPDAFEKTIDRSQVVGSSEWLANQFNKTPVTTTQIPRPDDKASQYLAAAGSALPGVMLMQPSTAGQAVTATAANVVPALASKATADVTKGTPYETTAPILANLIAQGGVNYTMAPKPAKPIDKQRVEVLKESQKEGYVVPPSTTNPTVANKIVESVGGKIATKQDAAKQNTFVTNELAKRALGISSEKPINSAELQAVRDKAGKIYEKVSKVGDFDALGAKLPASVNVDRGTDPLTLAKKNKVSSAELVRAWKQANHDSSTYYKAYQRDANPETLARAKAESAAEKNIFSFLKASLENNGHKRLADDLVDARREIAKTYSVDRALEADSAVSAYALGKQLDNGAPFEGDLLTAAKFGRSFPQLGKPVLDSGSVNAADMIVSGGVAAASKEPSFLMYPFSRMAARDLLLSKAGQRLAVPSLPKDFVQLLTPEQRAAMLMLNQSAVSSQRGSK